MPEAPAKFYLTTPIYYVNARPHIGHAYTTIVADVLARRSRAQGTDTWFLTGTDEHGQKIERSADAAGIPPQQFADQISRQFQDLWDRMGLTYNQFIRTTDPAHKRGVQKLFRTLQENGHIYLDSYTGAYCVSDETFVDVPTGAPCPDCGRPTETVTEENYFFRLSAFQLPLLNLIESNTLVIEPESRRNEVLSFLRGPTTDPGAPHLDSEMWEAAPQLPRTAAGTPYLPGSLRDLSISRSSFTWGIPVPTDNRQQTTDNSQHVIYVWLDALANYMTAVGYGDDSPEAQARFAKYWPADLHIVGKEIIRFHCVYWPAFLLALNPAPNPGAPHLASEMWDSEQRSWEQAWLPKKIVAHGWLLFDDSKMSKSKGNIVRTETILEAFGTLCPPPAARPPQTEVISTQALPPHPPPPEVISTEASQSHRDAQWRDRRISPEAPQPSPASLKGTASAVPPPLTSEHAASAAEVRSPTPHDRDLFAADVLRYFLLREIPFGQDGSFSFEALITRYNADLANGYGNLVSRTLSMIQKYCTSIIPENNCPEVTEFPGNPAVEFFGMISGRGRFAYANNVDKTTFRLRHSAGSLQQGVDAALQNNDFTTAVDNLSWAVSITDGYLTSRTPWKMIDGLDRSEVLYTAAESIRIITALLHPILPHATANVWRQLGLGSIELASENGELRTLTWGGLQPGTRLGPLSPIFPRIEKKDIPRFIQQMTDMESPTPLSVVTAQQDATPQPKSDFPEAPIASKSVSSAQSVLSLSSDPAAPPRTSTLPEPNPGAHVAASAALTTERPDPTVPLTPNADASPQITIDDFAKIELRVAQIILAERIPKADKLLRLEVDLGYERRQILSGIAEWYTPEDLLGRRIVVITNLAPRTMRGLQSHGMLLAASTEGGKPYLATIDSSDLPLGSRLK